MYCYKISKSSWGIIVLLEIKTYSEIDYNSFKINDNLYLKLDNCRLTKPYYIFLINGLKWIESSINMQEKLMISIESIEFSPCDYQDEGLFFAIASWASDYFKLEKLSYDYVYDKNINRYIFNFSEKDFLGKRLLKESLQRVDIRF
ncbi:hypothetical protein [uncultured Tenacibaculum sp.]|uniref:hypothetical protein n=1 Tax=uncultured Tenacibaculum sp. TaxID=174713 RepID=UPI00262E4FB9|nr:hypothetical protein [uncultured Tenacibaculum sp.]